MKVKELMEELKKFDPELDVTDGTSAVYFVEELPGYYDGCFTRLIQDESLKPYYNVTGCKIIGKEQKVVIKFLDWEGVVGNDTNVVVETDEYSEKYNQRVEEFRNEMKNFEQKLLEKQIDNVMAKLDEGYQIRQSKFDKQGHFGVMWYVKDEEKIKLCQGEEQVVLKCQCIPTENGEYIYWEPSVTLDLFKDWEKNER